MNKIFDMLAAIDFANLGAGSVISIILVLLEILLRLKPSFKDYSIINFIYRLLDQLIPNLAKPLSPLEGIGVFRMKSKEIPNYLGDTSQSGTGGFYEPYDPREKPFTGSEHYAQAAPEEPKKPL